MAAMVVQPLHPLREWRLGQQPKMTLDAAAAGVGTFRPVWADWESGRRIPHPAFQRKIYRFTHGEVRPDHFIFPDGMPDLVTAELPFDCPAPLLDRAANVEGKAPEQPEVQLEAAE